MYYIYGLADPDTKVIRYVGQTAYPKKRLTDHISEARTSLRYNRKNNWIRSLLKKDRLPEMIILEELENKDKCSSAEIFHIAQMKDLGFDLTNSTEGGEGFYTLPKEAIERAASKRRGRAASEETKLKMSHSARKRMTPAEIERLKSISNQTPPNFYGEEVRNSKLTEKDVISIRKKLNSGIGITEVARQYANISMQCVHLAGTGKSWAHVKEPVYIPRKK